MTNPSPSQVPNGDRRFKPIFSTWIVAGIAVVLLIGGTATSGFAGFLMMLGFIGLITAVYSLATGRRSWALIPSRKIAAVVLAACLVTTGVGGAIAGPSKNTTAADTTSATIAPATHTPTPTLKPATFTIESPADPATVTIPADLASVVIVDSTATDTTATALLATLVVKGKAPKTGYDRTGEFGAAWLDVDRNGCDTRNDILARDLDPETKSGTCRVLTGVLADPYTGKTIAFVRGAGTSALVQIDHVVALSNAWQTGAQQLTRAQRISLANDPLNLLAVNGRSNTQKGAGDTATWLPPNKSFRCAYVARQISVKATYGLWITVAEHDAMATVLSSCADVRATTSAFTPAPAPVVVTPTPAPVVVVPAPVAPKPAPAAPAPAPAPVTPGGGATALCNDGSYSYAAHHQGACSHHGGVAVFYK